MDRKRDGFARGAVTGAALTAVIVLVGAGRGQPTSTTPSTAPTPTPPDRIIGIAATDEKLFRVWESGKIEFLGVDLDTGSLEGVPDWSPVKIDKTMVWDFRGRNFRKKQ